MSIPIIIKSRAQILYDALEDGKIDIPALKSFLHLVSSYENEKPLTDHDRLYLKHLAALEKYSQKRLEKLKKKSNGPN